MDIPERNRLVEQTAEDILNKIYELTEQCEDNGESCNDLNNRIHAYISRHYLYGSDYTK